MLENLKYFDESKKEYLITNGCGSYSSGAINGNLSRQYHGILVHAFNPPVDRVMVAHKVEEFFNEIPLFTRRQIVAGKSKFVEGYKNCVEYTNTPFPKWTYQIENNFIEKEILMPYGKGMTLLSYEALIGGGELNIHFFLNYRDMHDYSKSTDHDYLVRIYPGYAEITQKGVVSYLYSTFELEAVDESIERIESFECDIIYERKQENLVYEIEIQERGAQKSDSSCHSLTLKANISPKKRVYLLYSMEKIENFSEKYCEELREERLHREKGLMDVFSNNFSRDLAKAADQFIVQRASTQSHSIIAGYPWFSDWARDAMIAISGLCITTKRFDAAKSIFNTFIHYLDQGMFPNKFPDSEGEELEYNTVDAALWYFVAMKNYFDTTQDRKFLVTMLLPAAKEIITFYEKGTRYGIFMDSDGLIQGGSKETQLTWMDVRFKGWAVTPRYGKAVEINALWYNALSTMLEYKSYLSSDECQNYRRIQELIEMNFEATFYSKEHKMLYDYVADGIANEEVRPNQIFAVSLAHSPISEKVQKEVVEKVFEKLYTPMGLRSLGKESHNFSGKYYGSLYKRDSVYHQGTVWTWPLGAFIDAHYKVYGDKSQLELLLKGIKSHFYDEGVIHSIAEIYDGDAPYECRGCFAQAWSVAEVLRVVEKYHLNI